MKKRLNVKTLLVLFSLIFVISLVVASVETNTILLKISLKQGDVVERGFNLFSLDGGPVSLEPVNLLGVSIKEDSIVLFPSESKTSNVHFDSSNLTPGIYSGHILIKSEDGSSKLPVLFEVESPDVLFDADLNIPPAYSEIDSGEKLLVQIKFFDLTFGTDGLGFKEVNLEYRIHSDDGALILLDQENSIINHDTGLTKSLILPKDLEEGNYFASVIIKYQSSVGVSSAVFSVSQKEGFLEFENSNDFSIIGLIIVLVLAVLFLFIYLLRDRDKIFIKLRRQNALELKEQRDFLLMQQKQLLKNKKVPIKIVKKEVKEKVIQLKKKQKERFENVKKSIKSKKSKKGIKDLREKIKPWKAKGYNTLLLESKLKGLNGSEMKTLMEKWKKKGYK